MHEGRSDYRSLGGRGIARLEWKVGVEYCRLLLTRPLGREVEFTALAFLPLQDLPLQDSLPHHLPFPGLLRRFLLSFFQCFRFGAKAMLVA